MAKITTVILTLFIIIATFYTVSQRKQLLKEVFDSPADSQLAALEQAFQNEPEKEAPTDSLKIPIFIYHSVRPHISGESKTQDRYDVAPRLLEQQFVYLRDNGYNTISLDDLVNDIKHGSAAPIEKPVILTFDDGWENQYRYAFPLLKKYHMTATFYIFTNAIGKKTHFLTWDQVKEMDAAGMTIGSHTLSHPYLKKLSSDELRKEIVESKKIIENELKKPVMHFASPFGYTSPEVVEIIKAAGYSTGRTTYKGIRHSKNDILQLRGILVNDNLSDFISVLNR